MEQITKEPPEEPKKEQQAGEQHVGEQQAEAQGQLPQEGRGQKALLRTVSNLFGDTVSGVDGDLGKVDDILFDDEQLVIRYFVVATGHWLSGRRVLLSPIALRQPEWGWPRLWVTLTKDEIAASPCLDVDLPIFRREEMEHHRHYGWGKYWGAGGLWGVWGTPHELAAAEPEETDTYEGELVRPAEEQREMQSKQPGAEQAHLYSAHRALGYHILASDGGIGRLEDMIVDGRTWQLRYMLINAGPWWHGKDLLLPLTRIRGVDRHERLVYVNLSREDIRNAPEWDHIQPVRPEYEAALIDYYAHVPG